MKNAKITVYNKKTNEDPIEIIYLGNIEERNDNTIITYEESHLTGMEGVFTELILGENFMEIVRTGNIESNLYFEEGLEKEFDYALEFGTLNLSVNCHKLYMVKDEEAIKIMIVYDILIPGNQKDRNEMKILVENI